MRDETRIKLDRLISCDRIAAIAAMGFVTALALVAYLAWVLPYGPGREAVGIVRNRWTVTKEEMLKRTVQLEVLLDDGRYAVAVSTFRNLPDIGSRVRVREQINWFGYHRYYWDGLPLDPPKHTP